MSKARTLANLISDTAELADGQISVAEVVGAAPTASPTFTGNIGTAGNITNASGDLTLDVAGDIILDADGGDVRLADAGTQFARLSDGSEFTISAMGTDKNIKLAGNDGGVAITALTLDMSEAGAATFNGGVTAIDLNLTSASPVIRFTETDQSNKNYILGSFGSAFAIYDNTASQYRYIIDTNGNHIFNEGGADVDFRVESDTKSHAFFVEGEGSSNRLKIGMGTGTITNPYSQNNFTDLNLDGVWGGVISFKLGGTEYGWIGQRNSGNGDMIVGASSGQSLFLASNGNTSRIELTDAGNVVVNPTGADNDFQVQSDANSHMLFVDAGGNQVKINTTSTTAPSSVDLVAGGGIHAGYASDIALSYRAGTYSNYYKGMSGKNPYNDVGRGLHIFNYDNDSDTGINFWSGSSESSSLYSIANFNAGATGEVVFNNDGLDRDFRVESDSNTHMLFVDAGNNRVGVGTGTPQTPMHIRSNSALNTTTELLRLDCGDNVHVGGKGGKIRFTDISVYNSTAEIIARREGVSGGSHLEFSLRDTVRLGLFSNGSFTTTPTTGGHAVFNEGGVDADFRVESNNNSHLLYVSDDQLRVATATAGGVGWTFYPTGSGSSPYMVQNKSQTSSTRAMAWQVNGSTTGSIDWDSTGTTYNTTSDRRLKDNIQPIADATDKLMSMKPVTHTWIADPEAPSVHGFIAQEMQEVVPEAVSGEDGGEEMMSMDYGRITPVLVAALQEATNEIKALKKRVSELEAK